MSSEIPKLIVGDKLELGVDMTLYLSKDEFWKQVKGTDLEKLLDEDLHYEGNLCLSKGDEEALGVEGRALICPCFEGTWYSITMRKDKFDDRTETELQQLADARTTLEALKKVPASDDQQKKLQEVQKIITSLEEILEKIGRSKYRKPQKQTSPIESGYQNTDGPSEQYPVRQETLYKFLFDNIFLPQKESQDQNTKSVQGTEEGLVIVSGATGSCKSTVVRGLIHEYINSYLQRERKRRLHLLTMEDPIEKKYTQKLYDDPYKLQAIGIDYTPRQVGSDARDLKTTLHDALRQTPRVVYVGETRNLRDWPNILQFSGTGHLVFTTSHASSLIESMDKVFRACKAETPAQWAQIGRRILAIVHLQPLEEGSPEEGSSQVVIPALWKRTPQSVAALVSDGLASFLPYADEKEACIGRNCWALKLLVDSAGSYFADIKDDRKKETFRQRVEIFQQRALEMDLEGN